MRWARSRFRAGFLARLRAGESRSLLIRGVCEYAEKDGGRAESGGRDRAADPMPLSRRRMLYAQPASTSATPFLILPISLDDAAVVAGRLHTKPFGFW